MKKKIIKRISLVFATMFIGLMAQPCVACTTQRDPLQECLSRDKITQSLAQFTHTSSVRPSDIEAYVDSVKRGGWLAHRLLFTTQLIPTYERREDYLHAIADLVSFFYLVAMLQRADHTMPYDVTFGIYDPSGRYKQFMQGYLAFPKRDGLALGLSTNLFGTNHLAYYRRQSHGFTNAWGINLYLSEEVSYAPLLFLSRWYRSEEERAAISGPLYHLLVGSAPHMAHKEYLKPEECGIYHWGEWFGHAKGYLKVLGRCIPLLHLLFDADDHHTCNKEQLPRTVLTRFRTELRAKQIRLGNEEKDAIRSGISGIYAYAKKNNWTTFAADLETKYPFPHLRHGNEIIIAKETINDYVNRIIRMA